MPDSDAHGAESAPFLLILQLVFLLSLCTTAQAHGGMHRLEFAQTIYGTFSFREVEMVARNHSVGVYRGAELHLRPWIAVSDDVTMGIDQEGRLVQVVQVPEIRDREGRVRPARVLGIPLSSNHSLRDFFLTQSGLLTAITTSGEVLTFSWEKWRKSALPEILRRYGIVGAGLVCFSTAATYLSACHLDLSVFSTPMLAQFFGTLFSTAGIQGFFATVHYERDNESPDGFEPGLGLLAQYRWSEFLRDETGLIVDYRLMTANGPTSLVHLLSQSPELIVRSQSFARSCEHDLLPRGIPLPIGE